LSCALLEAGTRQAISGVVQDNTFISALNSKLMQSLFFNLVPGTVLGIEILSSEPASIFSSLPEFPSDKPFRLKNRLTRREFFSG
jgi:hypothetical protein